MNEERTKKRKMLSLATGIHSVRVTLFENERYSPLSGWSAKGLLPTDRKTISSADGQDGFANLEEANQALLAKGWVWEADGSWMIDVGAPNADKEGWSYAADFTSFGDSDQTGSAQKGLIHFVRRRKLIRHQCLDLSTLADLHYMTCDYCDLQEVEKISSLLLEKFTFATLRRFPRHLNRSKVASLKSEFISLLNDNVYTGRLSSAIAEEDGGMRSTFSRISSSFSRARNVSQTHPPSQDSTSASNPFDEESHESIESQVSATEGVDMWKTVAEESSTEEMVSENMGAEQAGQYSLPSLSKLLDLFVAESQTAWSLASSVLKSGDNMSNVAQRRVEINAQYFMKEERDELARFVIRRHDRNNSFHCDQMNCGPTCAFAVEFCPNQPCIICYSKKWATKHDSVCLEKMLPCERACGVTIARKNMNMHLHNDCVLRPVKCLFDCIGCKAALLAKDLREHLEKENTSHLQLMLARQQEHQSVLGSLYKKVNELEDSNKSQASQIVALEAALATATVALKASETRHEKQLQDQINKLDSKVSRNMSNLNNEMQGEFGKVRKALQEMSKK